jgi:hypothetical protein
MGVWAMRRNGGYGGARLPNGLERFARLLAFPNDEVCCVIKLADLSDVALCLSKLRWCQGCEVGAGPSARPCRNVRQLPIAIQFVGRSGQSDYTVQNAGHGSAGITAQCVCVWEEVRTLANRFKTFRSLAPPSLVSPTRRYPALAVFSW